MPRIAASPFKSASRSAANAGQEAPAGASLRAFTLIELLVVISIIAALIAILIPATGAVLRAAEATRMQTTLAGLQAAAEEYRVVTGGVVNHTANRFPSAPTVNVRADDATDNNTIQLFVFEAGKVPNVADILVAAGREQLQDQSNGPAVTLSDPGTITDPDDIVFLDIFGNPIRYAAFVNKDDAFRDDDYLPAHPNPFFASAGPDGLWGTVNRSGEPDEEATDNLYSFDDL